MVRARLFVAILTAALALAGPLPAQDLGRVLTPIVTLDRDQIYKGTQYGQRVEAELNAASRALADETRRIEAQLEQEEKDLTAKRATMAATDFRALADAFDEKVQALRKDRDQAQTNMRNQIEAAQVQFFKNIGPVLGQLLRDRGAVLIVDRRAVLLAAADVDITQAAIDRIDQVLGDGSQLDQTTPAPDTAPAGGDSLDSIPAPAEDAPAPDTAPDAAPGETGLDTIPAPAEDGSSAPADGSAVQ